MPNLPEVKKPAPTDAWLSDRETWQYITIPEENPLGEVHATMGMGKHNFEAGKTYLVPPPVAEFLRERLKVYTKSVIRILQPGRDLAALRVVPVGTVGGQVANPVEASEVTSTN